MTFNSDSTGLASEVGSFDGLPSPQRYWAMLTIALAVGMTVIDGVVANVALPTIARDVVLVRPPPSGW